MIKQLALVILAIIAYLPLTAQEPQQQPRQPQQSQQGDGGVTSDISLTGQGSQDRLIGQITFDNWFHNAELSNGEDLQTEWYSRGVNIYVMYDIKFGDNSIFSIAPGIGYGHSSIFSNATIAQDSAGSFFQPTPGEGDIGINGEEIQELKKNKLALNYLEVPIELRMRTRPNKKGNSFKVALGFKGGWMFDAHTKVKYEVNKVSEDGTITKKVKEKNIENIFKFRYGPTFRIGYSSINLIAYYGLSGVFEDGQGPDVTPFSIGISFNGL